ncbi:MAG TPA: GntR family transcriptional regulator [Bacillota bacterium]
MGRTTKKSNTGYLRDKAYKMIKDMIINCQLTPGEPISEIDLMKTVGASRTPIREALNKLEHENLVIIYPKRGVFVTGISIKDIIDIYTIREVVEPLAAKLATSNIDLKELDRFYKIYADPEHQYTLEEHIKVDRDFHSLVARSTNNQLLEQILLRIYDQNSRIRILSKLRVKERHEEARQEHFELVKGFMDRDAERVEEVMKRHIANGKKTALKIV